MSSCVALKKGAQAQIFEELSIRSQHRHEAGGNLRYLNLCFDLHEFPLTDYPQYLFEMVQAEIRDLWQQAKPE